jgi:hypothetical protein
LRFLPRDTGVACNDAAVAAGVMGTSASGIDVSPSLPSASSISSASSGAGVWARVASAPLSAAADGGVPAAPVRWPWGVGAACHSSGRSNSAVCDSCRHSTLHGSWSAARTTPAASAQHMASLTQAPVSKAW